jgi:putative endonuclease
MLGRCVGDILHPLDDLSNTGRDGKLGATMMSEGGRMKGTRKQLGNAGEEIAVRELTRRGYAVRERNWRCPEGELDIVAEQGQVLVFAEVRTRRGDRFGSPEESITPSKCAHLIAAAQAYLQAHSLDCNWRIDVIAIEMSSRGELLRVDVIENAIEG